MTKPTLFTDTECYIDYWLIKFRNKKTGNMRSFELYAGHPLDIETIKKIMRSHRLVSFNGINYDVPIITLALAGADNKTLKKASDAIIVTGMKPWHIESNFNISIPKNLDHIDIIDVAPGVASLKMYGGRLHCKKMQDLPIEPGAKISPNDRVNLDLYCGNDLINTESLFDTLEKQIALREKMTGQYGMDLRSKSDAQIAEAVIKSGLIKLTGEKVTKPNVPAGTIFKYRKPSYIAYTTPTLQGVLKMVVDNDYVVSDGGKMLLPKELSEAKIKIGKSVYRMGIGGLHSSEKGVSHYADDDTILVDRDVASYYPMIILNQGLYPKHLGKEFLTVYGSIVRERLAAKAAGDKSTADSLKITINGSFGKFGSKYSILYSPDLLIQTTITGQLALLMLIETLENVGIPVVSANTDGIVIACPKRLIGNMDDIVADWERKTQFETEATYYRALHSRDVNNYIAVKTDGGYKSKGAYAPAGLQKNPSNEICSQAVSEFLVNGKSIDDTIRNCRDIRRFVTVRQVNGGAVKGDVYLGKAIRWYYAAGARGQINYKINDHKVPRSECSKPIMDLPDNFPTDINYRWYINEAISMLDDMGITLKQLYPDHADLI